MHVTTYISVGCPVNFLCIIPKPTLIVSQAASSGVVGWLARLNAQDQPYPSLVRSWTSICGILVSCPGLRTRLRGDPFRDPYPDIRPSIDHVLIVMLMREKITGLPPNLDFNPLFTRFNFTEFCIQACCIQRVCSTSREKRTSKHGISIVLKLVSIEYQKRDTFLAAV